MNHVTLGLLHKKSPSDYCTLSSPVETQDLIEKISQVSEEKLARILVPAFKIWLNEFRTQSYPLSALKIVALPAYLSVFGAGILTTWASIDLLWNSQYSDAFSTNIATRVNFANIFTNTGALLACLTDLQAITYGVYSLVFQRAHQEATRQIVDESYHSFISQYHRLTQEQHEDLYKWHIGRLQELEIENFYIHPDLLSKTGIIHQQLIPCLQDVDELCTTNHLSEIANRSFNEFQTHPILNRVSKIGGGILAIASIALALFLLVEDAVLLKDTPLTDLYSSNIKDQMNEAFYITQIGSSFSALTALGATAYIVYSLFIRSTCQKVMQEKTEEYFSNSRWKNISNPMLDTLHQIKNMKLKKWAN